MLMTSMRRITRVRGWGAWRCACPAMSTASTASAVQPNCTSHQCAGEHRSRHCSHRPAAASQASAVARIARWLGVNCCAAMSTRAAALARSQAMRSRTSSDTSHIGVNASRLSSTPISMSCMHWHNASTTKPALRQCGPTSSTELPSASTSRARPLVSQNKGLRPDQPRGAISTVSAGAF